MVFCSSDYSVGMLRCLVLEKLGEVGDPTVIKKSKEMLAAHVNGTQCIPADLRIAVYRFVVFFLFVHQAIFMLSYQ